MDLQSIPEALRVAEFWLSLMVNAYFFCTGAKYTITRIFGGRETLKDAAIAILFLFPAVPFGPIGMAFAYVNAPPGYKWPAAIWVLVAAGAANLWHLYQISKETDKPSN